MAGWNNSGLYLVLFLWLPPNGNERAPRRFEGEPRGTEPQSWWLHVAVDSGPQCIQYRCQGRALAPRARDSLSHTLLCLTLNGTCPQTFLAIETISVPGVTRAETCSALCLRPRLP